MVLSLNPGGTERLVIEIVKRLHADVPMAVCCLDDEGAWAHEIHALGVPVTALHRPSGFRPALGRAIARAATRHGARILHCHHYSPFVYGCMARLWRPGIRVIFTEHGRLSDAPPSAKRRLANRLLRHMPRHVFAVSQDLRHHLIAEGFSKQQVGIIYNGIDLCAVPAAAARAQIRRTLAVSEDTFVIGTIARLDPVKDLDTLIRATVALGRSTATPVALVVTGDGPERARLEELATSLGAGPTVRFLGHRDDARSLLAACDVYANSSISEGVSLTILEAMAAALPVVATSVGGTPEVIDRTCGRLVPPRNAEAMERALADLASQPGLRIELGHAARQRAEGRFTVERMVREYRDAYQRVA